MYIARNGAILPRRECVIARNKAILINGYEARNYTYFVVLQQLRKSRTFAAYILHIV
jgi:hypothetical protein